MSSFQGFTKPKPNSGKNNYGDAIPEDVVLGKKFSSATHINATGTYSNIKSIQQGTKLLPNDSLSTTITVNSVDTTKSLLLVTSLNNRTTSGFPANLMCRVVLTNSTTITLTRTDLNGDLYVDWQLIEFNGVKSRQSGTTSITNDDTVNNVIITSIDLSKSIVVINGMSNITDNEAYKMQYRAILTSSTNLAIYAYNQFDSYWQVLEFY